MGEELSVEKEKGKKKMIHYKFGKTKLQLEAKNEILFYVNSAREQ